MIALRARPRTTSWAGAAAVLALVFAAGCSTVPMAADPASDAPERRYVTGPAIAHVSSYDEALRTWRTAEDVNAWIGASFEYDPARALLLSETQRAAGVRVAIHAPRLLFEAPRGVCVDLARFGVETLRAIDPSLKPAYVMIEFAPISVAGHVLRRHWLASFERDGRLFFFADSKRPGHLAGPYDATQAFVEGYARYRGREIVAFRVTDSYERRPRTLRARTMREERTPVPEP